jgi:hypothetical protein
MKKSPLLAFAASLALSGCVFDSSTTNSGSKDATGSKVFVLGTQYSDAGGIAALDRVVGDTAISKAVLNLTTSDAVLDRDSANGILYVLDRSKGTVTGRKASDLSQVVLDASVGGDANPYAVARLSGKLWVACYGSQYLKALDVSTQKLVDSIDLSAYADTKDTQSVPQTFAMHAWNGKIAVVLGRLKGWKPGDSSLVLVVDPSTRQVTRRIALPWKNAYSADWSGDRLLVGCTGAWTTDDYSAMVLDGGVALVDLAAGTVRGLATEQDAGGNIAAVAFGPSGSAYVSISDASYANSVRTLDLSSGALGAKVSGSASVSSMAWSGSTLWMGTESSTLLRATASGTVLDTLQTTLPPTALVLLPE